MASRSGKKGRSNEQIVHRIREKRRLSRLDAEYNPNKPKKSDLDPWKPNTRFRLRKPTRGVSNLIAPERMNLGDNCAETLEFISAAHQNLIYGHASEVRLDLSNVVELSPAAALSISCEITRAREFSGSRRIRGRYPDEPSVIKMLTDIGFFKLLNIRTPPTVPSLEKSYFKIVPGMESSGKAADNLIGFFERGVNFTGVSKKRLYAALIECMDNVHAHAYDKVSNSPDLVGEWWMAGYSDLVSNRVSILFMDQGVGIPTTLKRKDSKSIQQRLIWPEHERIRDAVMHGVSRKSSPRHGNGLPSLRNFIDDIAIDGSLRVISNNGEFIYNKKDAANSRELPHEFHGSLIVWTIHHDGEVG